MASLFQRGPSESSDAIKTLTRDHQVFRNLYKQYSSSPYSSEKQMILNELLRGITIHDAVELAYLYPLVQRVFSSQEANHYREEHSEARNLLQEINGLNIDDPLVDDLVDQLMKGLYEHMGEEENTLFPHLQGTLTAQQLLDLGKSIDQARATVPINVSVTGPVNGTVTPFNRVLQSTRPPLNNGRRN